MKVLLVPPPTSPNLDTRAQNAGSCRHAQCDRRHARAQCACNALYRLTLRLLCSHPHDTGENGAPAHKACGGREHAEQCGCGRQFRSTALHSSAVNRRSFVCGTELEFTCMRATWRRRLIADSRKCHGDAPAGQGLLPGAARVNTAPAARGLGKDAAALSKHAQPSHFDRSNCHTLPLPQFRRHLCCFLVVVGGTRRRWEARTS